MAVAERARFFKSWLRGIASHTHEDQASGDASCPSPWRACPNCKCHVDWQAHLIDALFVQSLDLIAPDPVAVLTRCNVPNCKDVAGSAANELHAFPGQIAHGAVLCRRDGAGGKNSQSQQVSEETVSIRSAPSRITLTRERIGCLYSGSRRIAARAYHALHESAAVSYCWVAG